MRNLIITIFILLSTITTAQNDFNASVGISNNGVFSTHVQAIDRDRLVDMSIGLHLDSDNITPMTGFGYVKDNIGFMLSGGMSFKFRNVKRQDSFIYMENRHDVRLLGIAQVIAGNVTIGYCVDAFSSERGLMFGYRFKKN